MDTISGPLFRMDSSMFAARKDLVTAANALMDAAGITYSFVVERAESDPAPNDREKSGLGIALVTAAKVFIAAYNAYSAAKHKDGVLYSYTKVVECVGPSNAMLVKENPDCLKFKEDEFYVALYDAWDKRTEPVGV